ncbi:hypothetical protein QQS21_000020 [Conoideocrella luteorostrata]|uniref:Cell surface protein (Mas1) n=1 Tax=Conoideocrella luteorostrata TaxID=1105319 RepID=A0AAJ0D1F8_9HYPO|nr:hypothetical protein QQS21_000020 [Conoideocrella luteorostrata]
MSRLLAYLAFAAGVSAHGLILMTRGANGVIAPGACVLDGTPRDCVVNACGSQADTGIIRDAEINRGKYGPLGWTQGGGNCKADAVISEYMGVGTAPTYKGGSNPTGKEDDLKSFGIQSREEHSDERRAERREENRIVARQNRGGNSIFSLPVIGVAGVGGNRTMYSVETIVGDYAGQGKTDGLPTTNDNGEIELVYRQVRVSALFSSLPRETNIADLKVNEDGAGPLTAAVDPSSAGTNYKAFQSAKITQNVPGDGFVGLSVATNTNFPIRVQVPDGTVCEGKVAGLDNVCFVRVRNQAFAGPFGGAGFFTQSATARKRAVAYRRRSMSN